MEALDTATLFVLMAGVAGVVAVGTTRIARSVGVPAPAIFLALGVIVGALHEPARSAVGFDHVAVIGTFGLVLILYEGGFQGGWNRTRSALGPILGLGVVGTLLTTALLAAACHWLIGLPVMVSVLVAIALSPTDPAAVFSVLGSQEVEGRSDVVLEGESGANDPVGIALMLGAIDYYAASDGGGAIGHVALEFALGLAVGCAIGAVLGLLARVVLTHVNLGTAAYHAVAGLGVAFLIFVAATYLHGSGFLAVFVAGLVIGNAQLSEHEATDNVLSVGAALAEMTMFFVLGLTFAAGGLHGMALEALVAFALLTFVVRPLVTGVLLAPTSLNRAEKTFVAWGGLKGAVPILLASFPILAGLEGGDVVYATVFVAVGASILLQGTTLPVLARRTGLLVERR